MRAPLHVEFGSWPGAKGAKAWRCEKRKAPTSSNNAKSSVATEKIKSAFTIVPTVSAALEGLKSNAFSASSGKKSYHSRLMTKIPVNHRYCDSKTNTNNLSSCSARVSNAIIAGQKPDFGLKLEGDDQSFFGALQQRSPSTQDALR